MKKFIVVACLIGVSLGLTGCLREAPKTLERSVANEPASPSSSTGTGWYDTGDGRVVWCMYFGSGYGSYSCDWPNAKKPAE